MRGPYTRALVAGLAGGITVNLTMLLTFRLVGFGWKGGGVGEPLQLIALELLFWGAIALAEGFAIAAVSEWTPSRQRRRRGAA